MKQLTIALILFSTGCAGRDIYGAEVHKAIYLCKDKGGLMYILSSRYKARCMNGVYVEYFQSDVK